MYALTAWTFPTPEGASEALERLRAPAQGHPVAIDDAAVVAWQPRRKKPEMHELGTLHGPGTMWGGFWGLVLGMIFLVPLAGPTFGGAAGAVIGSLAEAGIDDAFVMSIRADVRPGTSALFVLSHGAAVDAIADALRDVDVTLVRSNLTIEEERELRAIFTEEEATA
jgi:uncharacterized membrane protein